MFYCRCYQRGMDREGQKALLVQLFVCRLAGVLVLLALRFLGPLPRRCVCLQMSEELFFCAVQKQS